MLTPVLIAVAVLTAILLVVIATRPTEFTVKRSAAMPFPAEVIFQHVNDLHLWQAWSPWARLDPNAKNSYSGSPSGGGAVMAWAGNNKVGEGRMTITESRPAQLIRFRLEFFKPFKATNTAEFTFQPQAGQTLITWSMSGRNNFMGKAFGLIINCDKMVGGQFEQGLANLRAVAGEPVTK
jgi:Polyketide cyclase / dehydrase and lipid transport